MNIGAAAWHICAVQQAALRMAYTEGCCGGCIVYNAV